MLTSDRQGFDDEIRRSRQDENAWPKLHYLWPQHPAIQWLQDKLLARVARHSAPVLVVPDTDAVEASIKPGQSVLLISGLIPNRKAHPVIWEWFAVACEAGKVVSLSPAEQWLSQLGLDERLPNRAEPVDVAGLEALRRPAIQAVQAEMEQRQQAFTEATAPQLAQKLEDLAVLEDRQVQQLELRLESSRQAANFKAARRERRLKHINRVFSDYQTWVRDTLTIEPVPYIQIIAAFTRDHG